MKEETNISIVSITKSYLEVSKREKKENHKDRKI